MHNLLAPGAMETPILMLRASTSWGVLPGWACVCGACSHLIEQCCVSWHCVQKLGETCRVCFAKRCLHSVLCFLLQVASHPSSLWCWLSQFACVLHIACYRPLMIMLHVVVCCKMVAYGCLLPFALCQSRFAGCIVVVVACCTLYVACG